MRNLFLLLLFLIAVFGCQHGPHPATAASPLPVEDRLEKLADELANGPDYDVAAMLYVIAGTVHSPDPAPRKALYEGLIKFAGYEVESDSLFEY